MRKSGNAKEAALSSEGKKGGKPVRIRQMAVQEDWNDRITFGEEGETSEGEGKGEVGFRTGERSPGEKIKWVSSNPFRGGKNRN